MKKFLFCLVSVLALALFGAPALLAQGAEMLATPIAQEAPFNIVDAFQTFGSLVLAIPIIVEFLKKYLTQTGGQFTDREKWVVKIASWITGLILAFGGWLLGLGFLAGLAWYYVLMYGVGASLAANGVASTKLIQAIFAIFIKKR